MSNYDINPFPSTDNDRYAIWEMLVLRDIDAFLQQDWSMVADDFIEAEFIGIHGQNTDNPDHWTLGYPDLGSYKAEWLRQAEAFAGEKFNDDPREAIHYATLLRDIEISGYRALVHKKFDGHITKADGTKDILNWQTVYYCKKLNGRWKITGFTGYLPNPMGVSKNMGFSNNMDQGKNPAER
ncbi:MAG: hypothetical protein JKY49_07985 [Cohaesibacteraceae bacterium]|nr:hypothetical protein [Cohaesibacteraceae bacterium]MBL4875275.1 hypothetical protein [Cohaesibacteraceae bacterium]